MQTPPANPAGPFEPVEAYDAELRAAVSGLDDQQLNTLYRNWSIRQITHHLADSHLHVMIRFKWALTEENPLIKAYNEADWVQLADCSSGAVEPALALLDGIHIKWVQVLDMMTQPQFECTYLHPETGDSVRLWTALNNYAWHGRHHTAQILWLRQLHGWTPAEGASNA